VYFNRAHKSCKTRTRACVWWVNPTWFRPPLSGFRWIAGNEHNTFDTVREWLLIGGRTSHTRNVQMSVLRSSSSGTYSNKCTGREGFGYDPADLLQNRRFYYKDKEIRSADWANADGVRSRPTFRFLFGTRSTTVG